MTASRPICYDEEKGGGRHIGSTAIDGIWAKPIVDILVEAAPGTAYEALKLSLWKPFEHDRDGYTQAKTAFVEGI